MDGDDLENKGRQIQETGKVRLSYEFQCACGAQLAMPLRSNASTRCWRCERAYVLVIGLEPVHRQVEPPVRVGQWPQTETK